MVLPNGSIVRVDDTKPELYRTMRGSGLSNFGIVTSFEVEAVESPRQGYWLAFASHGWDQSQAIIEALHDHLLENEMADLDTAIVPLFTYNAELGLPFVIMLQVHANHSDLSTPAAFQSFDDIPTLAPAEPRFYTYAETLQLAIDFGPPNGHRHSSAVTAFRPSVAAMTDVVGYIKGVFERIKHIEGLSTNAVPSPVYRNIIKQMSKRGSNSLCIDPDEEPFWVWAFAASWNNSKDDEFMSNIVKGTILDIEAVTKKHGVYHPYKYFNYAGAWQAKDVWAGYNSDDLGRMKQLQKEYDPDQVFVAGGLNSLGFKLNSKKEASNLRDEL
jgi:FAD/FMN-containing dehydrogenase